MELQPKQRGQKERDQAIEAILAHENRLCLISVSDCDAVTAEYQEFLKKIFFEIIGRVFMCELYFKPLLVERLSPLLPMRIAKVQPLMPFK